MWMSCFVKENDTTRCAVCEDYAMYDLNTTIAHRSVTQHQICRLQKYVFHDFIQIQLHIEIVH